MRTIIIGIIALSVAACSSGPQRINDDYSQEEGGAAERERLLDELFNCDECGNGQLRRVAELGNFAVPRLIEIKNGTVPNKTVDFTQRCERIHSRLAEREIAPTESCAQYSARNQEKLERRYRARAIEGLFAIRTRSACNAIGIEICNENPPFPGLTIDFSTDRSIRHMGVDTPIE